MLRILTLVFFFSSFCLGANTLHSFTKDTVLMGVSFSFTAVCESEEQAIEGVNAASDEVIRIEKLISSWDPHSQTSDVNNNAGIQAVQVDQELIALIERSLKISELTNGYFDITFASLDEIWRFDEYKTEELPSQEELLSSVSKIGYKNIIIDKKNGTVFLKDKGMKMGFGAIGKGYAANRAMLIMKDLRIKNGVVNAGGDLINWGKDKDNQPWTIGITDPKNKDEVISWLNVSDLAIVTSGNYEKFVEINGKRYSHIINPKTGMPVENLSSVSILCPDAEFADALATSIFILGKSEGMKLVNHLDQVECIIIDDQKNIFTSNNLEKRIWLK